MRLEKEIMICAAHMVHTQESNGVLGKCTRIHGHNWFITINVLGEVQNDGMVIDFGKLKKIVMDFDHKIILPIDIVTATADENNVNVAIHINDKYYELPMEDVELINYPVVTSEHLAQEIIDRLIDTFGGEYQFGVEIEETPGSICGVEQYDE